jgi:serine/threonine-protein kinase
VTYFGEVKLIDFGVAKAATNVAHTRAGMLKGKISYMSPEQLRGRGLDRRSDLFSVGVVLWELLTGVRLFARDSDAATLYAVIDDPIPPVRAHRPDVPDALVAIVARALAREPADRWATAEALQLALDGFLATLPHHESVVPGRGPGPGGSHGAADSGPRGLARELEQLFGAARSNAKRGVAQNRALASNIAVVATLHGSVTPAPAGSFAQVSDGPTVAERDAPRRRRSWTWAVALLVAVGVAGAGAGLIYVAGHHEVAAPAPAKPAPVTLTVTSSPAGAAIYVAGEPTGMTTPATLSNIAPGRVAIRLELAGYPTSETVVELAPGANLTREIRLGPPRAIGRIILANLPSGAVAIVDGDRYPAGEAIPALAGRHAVRVVVDAQTVVEQTIETTGGDQIWELADHQLSPGRFR